MKINKNPEICFKTYMSECCEAPSLTEIVDDGAMFYGICSCCKDTGTFMEYGSIESDE